MGGRQRRGGVKRSPAQDRLLLAISSGPRGDSGEYERAEATPLDFLSLRALASSGYVEWAYLTGSGFRARLTDAGGARAKSITPARVSP